MRRTFVQNDVIGPYAVDGVPGRIGLPPTRTRLLWGITAAVRGRYVVVLAVVISLAVASVMELYAVRQYSATCRLLFKPSPMPVEPWQLSDDDMYYYGWTKAKEFNTRLEMFVSDTVIGLATSRLGGRLSPEQIRAGVAVASGPNSAGRNNIIDVTFTHSDTGLARLAANRVAESYLAYLELARQRSVDDRLARTRKRIDDLDNELNERLNALTAFRENHGITDIGDLVSRSTALTDALEQDLQDTRTGIVESQRTIDAVTSEMGRRQAEEVVSSQLVLDAHMRVAELRVKRTELLVTNTADHPAVRRVDRQIDQLERAIGQAVPRTGSEVRGPNLIRQSLAEDRERLALNESRLKARERALKQMVRRSSTSRSLVPSLQRTHDSLAREVETIRPTLADLRLRFELLRASFDDEEPPFEVLEPASLCVLVKGRSLAGSLMQAVLLGLGLGLALALGGAKLRDTFNEPYDVEDKLGTPVLAVVPQAQEPDMGAAEKPGRSRTLETVRFLRAELEHSVLKQKSTSILVTSPQQGDGKTHIAAHLAKTLALSGRITVLIDADMRRPRIHKLFGLDRSEGLSELLAGQRTLEQVAQPGGVANLFVVTAGERVSDPGALLGRSDFRALVHEQCRFADVIVIDSSPLLPVGDAVTLAPQVDVCVLVLKAGVTLRRAAFAAQRRLAGVGRRINGAVLNSLEPATVWYSRFANRSHKSYVYYYDYDDPEGSLPRQCVETGASAVRSTFSELGALLSAGAKAGLKQRTSHESGRTTPAPPNDDQGRRGGQSPD